MTLKQSMRLVLFIWLPRMYLKESEWIILIQTQKFKTSPYVAEFTPGGWHRWFCLCIWVSGYHVKNIAFSYELFIYNSHENHAKIN